MPKIPRIWQTQDPHTGAGTVIVPTELGGAKEQAMAATMGRIREGAKSVYKALEQKNSLREAQEEQLAWSELRADISPVIAQDEDEVFGARGYDAYSTSLHYLPKTDKRVSEKVNEFLKTRYPDLSEEQRINLYHRAKMLTRTRYDQLIMHGEIQRDVALIEGYENDTNLIISDAERDIRIGLDSISSNSLDTPDEIKQNAESLFRDIKDKRILEILDNIEGYAVVGDWDDNQIDDAQEIGRKIVIDGLTRFLISEEPELADWILSPDNNSETSNEVKSLYSEDEIEKLRGGIQTRLEVRELAREKVEKAKYEQARLEKIREVSNLIQDGKHEQAETMINDSEFIEDSEKEQFRRSNDKALRGEIEDSDPIVFEEVLDRAYIKPGSITPSEIYALEGLSLKHKKEFDQANAKASETSESVKARCETMLRMLSGDHIEMAFGDNEEENNAGYYKVLKAFKEFMDEKPDAEWSELKKFYDDTVVPLIKKKPYEAPASKADEKSAMPVQNEQRADVPNGNDREGVVISENDAQGVTDQQIQEGKENNEPLIWKDDGRIDIDAMEAKKPVDPKLRKIYEEYNFNKIYKKASSSDAMLSTTDSGPEIRQARKIDFHKESSAPQSGELTLDSRTTPLIANTKPLPEINGPLPSFGSLAGTGIRAWTHGSLSIPKVGATWLEIIGHKVKQYGRKMAEHPERGGLTGPGSIWIKKKTGPLLEKAGGYVEGFGEELKEFWGEQAEFYEMPEHLRGSVFENPTLLLNPEWLAYSIIETAPSFVLTLGSGTAAMKFIEVGGKAVPLTDDVIKILSRAGTLITGSTVDGMMDGAGTFETARGMGMDKDEATAKAAEMTLASIAINALSMGEMLDKVSPGSYKRLLKFITDSLANGTTEYLKEPMEAYILGEDVGRAWKDGLNVFFPALITGGVEASVESKVTSQTKKRL